MPPRVEGNANCAGQRPSSDPVMCGRFGKFMTNSLYPADTTAIGR